VRWLADSPAIMREPGSGTREIVELCVEEELRSGRLVALKTSRLSLERPLYSLRLRGRHLNRSALTFLQSFEYPRASLDLA
jgi:hypothetical protein